MNVYPFPKFVPFFAFCIFSAFILYVYYPTNPRPSLLQVQEAGGFSVISERRNTFVGLTPNPRHAVLLFPREIQEPAIICKVCIVAT